MGDLRIATRRSRLAMAQAHRIAARLCDVEPDLVVDFVEISTSGDIDRVSPVVALTEMGAFVRAVQHAVLDGEADIAVHSCKDLPVIGPGDLHQWYPERESPWDVLCGSNLAGLEPGAVIGTGSPRRAAQMLLIRPDVRVIDIRGNVPTRIAKIGVEVDAVILAEAGLQRLSLLEAIDHRFDLTEMVPAPAQGAICLEARPDTPAASVLASIDDAGVRTAVEAERLLLAATGAGCRSALGCLVETQAGGLIMSTFVSDDAGPRRTVVDAADAEGAVSLTRTELAI